MPSERRYVNQWTYDSAADCVLGSPQKAVCLLSLRCQASGSQVQSAAATMNATVDTTASNDTLAAYPCTILSTNRANDNVSDELWGTGYFILEVQVQQTVRVSTVSGTVLSDDNVRSLLVYGFDQSNGGSIAFRVLLRRNADFATVLSVNVQDWFSSEPPTVAPTAPPTDGPTQSPTVAPTQEPSSEPPTTSPSSPAPSPSPTTSPTTNPTHVTSSMPSEMPRAVPRFPAPSPSPTTQSLEKSSSAPSSRLPLIFGAMAGGAAAILASCFFIFCVWFPICRPKASDDSSKEEDDDNDGEAGMARGNIRCSPPSLTSSVVRRPLHAADFSSSVVPDEVELDADHESLADTTLGDLTAGGELVKRTQWEQQQQNLLLQAASKSQQRVEHLRIKQPYSKHSSPKFMKEPAQVRPSAQTKSSKSKVTSPLVSNSFDENSIYTTTADGDAIEAIAAQGSQAGPNKPKSSKNRLPPSSSRSPHDTTVPRSTTMSADNSRESLKKLELFSPRGKGRSKGSVGSDSGRLSFPGTEPVKSDEDKALLVAQSMNAGTKGFDPFQEDDVSESSALHFEDKAHSETLRQKVYSPEELDDRSAPSHSSGRTKKVKNRLHPTDTLLLDRKQAEEKREIEEENQDYATITDQYFGMGRKPRNPASESASIDQSDNDALLRSVLEDARRLSRSGGLSSRSQLSRQSAPSRLSNFRAQKVASPPLDLMADNQDLDDFLAARNAAKSRTSSHTVGASVYGGSRRAPLGLNARARQGKANVDRTVSQGQTKHRQDSVSSDSFRQASATQEDNKKTAVAYSVPSSYLAPDSSTAKSRSVPNSSSGRLDASGSVGADPRDLSNEQNRPGSNMPDTPMSSPGFLGITEKPPRQNSPDDGSSGSEGLSNPWLYDAIEQTLGPRSPAADMESISGRSSRSERSLKSSRSGRSHHSQDTSKSRSSRKSSSRRRATSASSGSAKTPPSYPSRASTTRATINGSIAEQKEDASEINLTPRTLEYDLQRLEVHMSDVRVLQDTDQMTTSTITASTAGASRSTLSSKRMPARRSNAKRVVVVVPPGRLGVVLADRHDGRGTMVREVRPTSALAGMISPGDKLRKSGTFSSAPAQMSDCCSHQVLVCAVAIDGEDVRNMYMNQVTSLIAAKIGQQRRLTILTSSPEFDDVPETKDEDFVE